MANLPPDELYSVLEVLKPALKSIDIRTIAVAPLSEDPWQNLITSIHISEMTVEERRKEQEKIPILMNNQFALFMAVYPVDYSFFVEIQNGQVIFHNRFGYNKVKFRQFDTLNLKVYSTYKYVRDLGRWIITASASGSAKEREKLWSIISNQEREAKLQGFSSVLEIIKDRLEIDYNHGEIKDFDLTIPSLATFESTCVKDSKLNVKIKQVTGLHNLQLNLAVERPENNYRKVWNTTVKLIEILEHNDDVNPKKFNEIEQSFELQKVLSHDRINLELILTPSAMTFDRKVEEIPLENTIEPFLKIMESFCSLVKFQKMLFEPENYGKSPSKTFENAIAWLLSLSGYNVIYLGAEVKTGNGKESFDVLRNKTGFQVGCSDIIAYEENKRLLLIDCDIGSIDNKKIQQLIDTGKYFSQNSDYRQLELIPMLVTSKEYTGEVKQGSRIVDGNRLKRILEQVAKGDRQGARDTFCSGW